MESYEEDVGGQWMDAADHALARWGPSPCRPCTVLVVGRALALEVRSGLRRAGHQVVGAHDLAAAWSLLATCRLDAVVLDLADPEAMGLRLLKSMQRRGFDVPVIAVLAPGPCAHAGAAIAAGAHLLARPVARGALQALLVRTAIEQQRKGALAYYQQLESQRAGLQHLIGDSLPMVRLKTQLRMMLDAGVVGHAGVHRSVLVHGELGSGKSSVARVLHFEGPRRAAAFVTVDLSRLAPQEIEAHLFGGPSIAGGGIRARQPGLVEAADGGTMYIREVGSAPPAVLSRLATLVRQGTMNRAGGMGEVPIDVQLILATREPPTTRNGVGDRMAGLAQLLAAERLAVPALRDRGDDLWLLTTRFLKSHAEHDGEPVPELSAAARAALARYHWPGNVRELRYTLERAVMLQQGGVIEAAHLAPVPPATTREDSAAWPSKSLQQLEREALSRALQRAHGNVSAAARLLSITRDTLRYRMRRHRLDALDCIGPPPA